MKQWYLLETKEDYNHAATRYEQIRDARKVSRHYKEMMLLVFLVSEYEKKKWKPVEVDPIEYIKIRMEDFGYTASDLAREYGDKEL